MSSGSDSDEDFVPGEPEQVSEEDSADDETEQQYENEVEEKTMKRKAVQEKTGKKRLKTRNKIELIQEKNTEILEKSTEDIPEVDKQKEEDLWAKFLEGTDSKPKNSSFNTSNNETVKSTPMPLNNQRKEITKSKDDDKEKEKRIFEFAGETIVVENNVIKEKIKTTNSPVAASGPSSAVRRSGGGLSSVLGALNSKNKLSTLEKSKLDWNTFKKQEGIEDEIQTHNKGKDGYLDRQDFLERTDVRQYELERDLRMTRRSNRL